VRSLFRFLTLPMPARRLVAWTAALQIAARAAVACAGLPRAVRLAQWLGARVPQVTDLASLAWALSASSRRVGGTCLTQALAARVMTARSADPSRLIVAVRPGRNAAGPEFHAWTELSGRTFPATVDRGSFTPLRVWN
jgi:hypothetical protein